jgi:hypothetical protein
MWLEFRIPQKEGGPLIVVCERDETPVSGQCRWCRGSNGPATKKTRVSDFTCTKDGEPLGDITATAVLAKASIMQVCNVGDPYCPRCATAHNDDIVDNVRNRSMRMREVAAPV